MDETRAVAAFAALAHPQRLRLFRLLIEEGRAGLPAGEISAKLDLPASTLSGHLAQLQQAGLLRAWRDRRHIYYAVCLEGARALVDFLIRDCCRGHPEICGMVTPGGPPGETAPDGRSRAPA